MDENNLLDTDTNPEFLGDENPDELTLWIETDITLKELSFEGQKSVREYLKQKEDTNG